MFLSALIVIEMGDYRKFPKNLCIKIQAVCPVYIKTRFVNFVHRQAKTGKRHGGSGSQTERGTCFHALSYFRQQRRTPQIAHRIRRTARSRENIVGRIERLQK